MTVCPSCGRDPGPNDVCPHCGADLQRRIRIRTFGLISIGVALLGLIVLWLFATRAPIAQVKINQAQSTSNYAYVQIDGLVTRSPSYNPDSQSLTFWVRDDTGEMMVSAFRSDVQSLIAADKVPAPGDTVSVQGTLRVRDAVPSLTINSVEAVTLLRATSNAPARDLGSITTADDLQAVTVRGVVRAIKTPYEGLRLITLRDATGAIDVAVSSDIESLSGAAPAVAVGQSLQVVGTVTLFDTTPQLTLNRGSDMSLLTDSIDVARPASIGDLSEADTGRWLRISGTVEKVSPFSAGFKVTLSDNGKRLTALFWQDLWDALSIQTQVQPEAQLSVQGEINSFQGQLEIVPEIDQDVALLAAPPAAVVSAKSIGAITSDDVKSSVQTTGTIDQVDEFSQGIRYTLQDDSGSIILLIWSDVIDPAQQQQLLQVGTTVSVTGQIDEFNNQLELVPQTSDQIGIVSTPAPSTPTPTPIATPEATPTAAATALAATATPASTTAPETSAQLAPIGALTLANVDQTFMVQAKVVEVSSFSSGFNFLLDDGSGKIHLTLFNDTYKFVPGRSGLNLNAEVSVVAKVVNFNGVLELQPNSGKDVTILTPGSNASVPVSPINSLTKAGLIVAVEGTVTDVKVSGSVTNLTVDDGTGTVRVTLFSNVLAYVPNAAGLVNGARVRAVGKTDFFAGKLEVVPQLGYDLTIQ
jgi:DNA/RNA endonuclease YhcR with UshA esterase domain